MATDRFKSDKSPGSRPHEVATQQFDAAQSDEASQRIGPLAELLSLLREFGTDPAEVIASAGLDLEAFGAEENRIPYVAVGRLLYECVVKTGCPHFSLLLGQRTRLSHLGLPGQLVRHSPTLGAAIRTYALYQHLDTQGMAKFLLEKDGVATLGNIVYQTGTEHVDQIYDIDVAATLSVIRELCGTHWRPERVLFSHSKPADVVPYRRFFQAPCRFDSERTALVFPGSMLEQKIPGVDPKQFRILEAQAHARADFGLVFRLRRTLGVLLLAEAASGDEVAKLL
jgi:hypothetical protein